MEPLPKRLHSTVTASVRSRPFISIHQAPLMNKTFDQLSWTIEINEIGIVQCVIWDFTTRSTLNPEGQGGLQENRTCAVTTNLLSRGSQLGLCSAVTTLMLFF